MPHFLIQLTNWGSNIQTFEPVGAIFIHTPTVQLQYWEGVVDDQKGERQELGVRVSTFTNVRVRNELKLR